VSFEAIDFIESMLKRNPEHRLSAENALNHAWFDDILELKRITSE
jgi:serine/threonine protein kinase